MKDTLMRLQDERKEIVRKYREREISSKDAIKLLRENDQKKLRAKRRISKAAAC